MGQATRLTLNFAGIGVTKHLALRMTALDRQFYQMQTPPAGTERSESAQKTAASEEAAAGGTLKRDSRELTQIQVVSDPSQVRLHVSMHA